MITDMNPICEPCDGKGRCNPSCCDASKNYIAQIAYAKECLEKVALLRDGCPSGEVANELGAYLHICATDIEMLIEANEEGPQA